MITLSQEVLNIIMAEANSNNRVIHRSKVIDKLYIKRCDLNKIGAIYSIVDKMLHTLVNDKQIKRIKTGIYKKM